MAGRIPVLLAGAAVLAVAGCGPGAGDDGGEATITVTRDFGSRPVLSRTLPEVSGSETAMRLLGREARVQTRYGGGFVQSVDGVEGGRRDGRPVDWFYFVNGREAPKGAAATKVRPGDAVWWDFRDWGEATNVPAVVGSFPEPFLHGPGTEKRLPVRVECIEVESAACRAASRALADEGVPVATAQFRSQVAQETIRVLVGPWRALREETSVLSLEDGPGASGVYARPSADGRQVAVLDPEGRTVRTLGAGAGLVAATASGEGPPVWVVTGTDDAGVAAAAGSLDAGKLANRYALAVEGGRLYPAPRVGGAR